MEKKNRKLEDHRDMLFRMSQDIDDVIMSYKGFTANDIMGMLDMIKMNLVFFTYNLKDGKNKDK